MSIQEQNTTRLSNQNTLHNSPKKAPDSTPQHDAKMRRRLFAARAGFFTGGFTVASWAPIIPFVQTELSLEPAVLGTLLFGLGIGSFFGMPIAGTVSTRFGNRAALAASGVLSCLLLVVLAMIPGTSRSGATILGAMLIGCSRPAAAEFSFFLGIPVMFGASFLKIVKFFIQGGGFSFAEFIYLVLGMVVAFGVSVYSIKFLMGYVRKHDFKFFGYYRIVLGIVVLSYFGISALVG